MSRFLKRRPRRRRVVLWGGRPDRDLRFGAACSFRRGVIARAAAARDRAIAAGDLDAARQYAVQGLVTAAAQRSADEGGAFVRAFREPVVDPTPLAPADAELLKRMRARRGGIVSRVSVRRCGAGPLHYE